MCVFFRFRSQLKSATQNVTSAAMLRHDFVTYSPGCLEEGKGRVVVKWRDGGGSWSSCKVTETASILCPTNSQHLHPPFPPPLPHHFTHTSARAHTHTPQRIFHTFSPQGVTRNAPYFNLSPFPLSRQSHVWSSRYVISKIYLMLNYYCRLRDITCTQCWSEQ